MRVLLIVVGLPSGLALFGSAIGAAGLVRGGTVSSFTELTTLVIISSAVAAEEPVRTVKRYEGQGIEVTYDSADLQGATPVVSVSGWNLPKIDIAAP